ncbi:MAG TPA: PAS domain S-box protein [Polyangia bacterium]|nr:PAS domain S-box protein [Polyangia bacterium]
MTAPIRLQVRVISTIVAAVAALALLQPSPAGAAGRHVDADFVSAPLLKVADAHALTAGEARQDRPIRVRGVVTFVSEQGTALFIQDETDGIYVDSTERPSRSYQAGQLAEAEGYTSPGLFAPQIRLHRLIMLGPAPLPAPRKSSYHDLATGEFDCKLVEMEGTVRWIGPEQRPNGQLRFLMRLHAAGIAFPVHLEVGEPFVPPNLLDARVRVRGVVGGMFNARRQMIGIVLYVDRGRDVVVERPAAADAFAAPPSSINGLLQYSKGSKVNQRVRIRGTVTLHHRGSDLFIWDGSGGVAVQTFQTEPTLAVGDDVEVIGFPTLGEWSPTVQDASYRRVGRSKLPAPIATTAVRESSGRNHDAQLVTLEAELVDVMNGAEKQILVMSDGDRIFSAELGQSAAIDGRDARLETEGDRAQRGSVLRLTGISVVRLGTLLRRPTSFDLMLRSPADIEVVTQASWWTLTRLLWSLAALAAIFTIVIVWVVFLRRRVQDQTEIIRRQLQNEAALEEQYRDLFQNANDMIYSHDLDGRLTTINRAGEEITGFGHSEILTRSFFDMMVPERRDDARRRLQRVAAGMEIAATFDSEIVAKDGRIVALEVSVRLLARDSKLVGFEGIARDVSARKRAEAELAAANQTLLAASRQAGMAEVASSVLHNVGNVLNTVNLSASLVAQGIKRSRIQNVTKVAAMITDHADDLAAFLTTDPQGRHLPAYLVGLAEHIGTEHASLAAEINTLIQSVDHIKEVVAMQQGYARRVGGTEEAVPAVTLIEDAVRMLPQATSPDNVQLVREYIAQPDVTVDKHRVLQILVNVISNARQACVDRIGAGGPGSGGRVILRLETNAVTGGTRPTHFRITIADNGTGIAPHNLTRIFEHGFTTKKDGHGFGLHGAALAARALGGTLTVKSDGAGQGAAFVLELPLRERIRAERQPPAERVTG